MSEVWDSLQDAEVLAACIDGCEEMTESQPDVYACVVAVKIGPVKARFSGEIQVVDKQPPQSYALNVKASSGAGFGEGRATVELTEVAEGTKLSYHVEGVLGGKLAQIGSRLVQSFSRKMARKFFDSFSKNWVT